MPTRPSVPAPRPLSPRAAAYVRQVFEETAARQSAIEKAVLAATAPARPVAKAKAKNAQVACYDADGNLVGVVDPDAITMVAAAKAPNAPDAPPTDLTPAPAASAGTPADAVPAAKAMSLGARGHQLGGPTPRGGVPVLPAEDAEQEIAKARALSAELKKALNGGSNVSAAEANRVAEAMNRAALAKYQDMQRRGLALGLPRRP